MSKTRAVRKKAEKLEEHSPTSSGLPGSNYAVLAVGIAVLLLWVRKQRREAAEQLRLDFLHVPPMLVLEGWAGKNHHRINGIYYLAEERYRDRPVWAKRVPEGNNSESFLLYDQCGAWLLSHHPTGEGNHCDGWAYVDGCRFPWKCGGNWQVYGGAKLGWIKVTGLFEVTPLWDEELLPGQCTEEQEKLLAEENGKLDLVIPWVNGSDPAWLQRRHEACFDWQWHWMWPDALQNRASKASNCIYTEGELPALSLPGGLTSDEESTCPAGTLPDEYKAGEASQGCDNAFAAAERSKCFREFAEFHCGGRVKSIADHDELRYLLRSVEASLRWHTGRILLVLPKGQRPHWLKEDAELGRLKVIEQEVLLELAMASEHFVPHELRGGGPGSFAPGRIFNDFPIINTFPFIPDVSSRILLMDDDLILARPMLACEVFTPTGGLRLFAEPYTNPRREDPYSAVFNSLVRYTSGLWEGGHHTSGPGGHMQNSGAAAAYYTPFHAPGLLDMSIFKLLWAQYPNELSATLDSSVRHPNMTDIVGLHHSELADRSFKARQQIASDVEENRTYEVDPAARTWVIDLREFPEELVPINLRWFWEVYFDEGTVEEWDRLMSTVKEPEPSKLPQLMSFQDHISAENGRTPELDCRREDWLNKLLPSPSSFEDLSKPPDRCARLASHAGEAAGGGAAEP